jgi:Uma2 family endonuclease
MSRMLVSLEGLDLEEQGVLFQFTRPISRREYTDFVQANPDFRIERTAEGDVILMPPAHARSGLQNAEITRQLGNWANRDGSGSAFDSSAGFDLPNGSNRSPDASWVRNSRLAALRPEEKEEYLPLCPDFVMELRSKSDRLAALKAKMEEYLGNGAQLGWLIDPVEQRVYVYRPGKAPEILEKPAAVSAEPEMPGFTLDLARVWNPQL